MAIRYYLEFVTVPAAILLLTALFPPFSTAQVSAVAVGYLVWVLAEYWMHRTFFHERRSPFHAAHMIHHRLPLSEDGSPGTIKTHVLLALVIFWTFWTFGSFLGGPLLVGFALGYLSYIVTHHMIHAEWLAESNPIRVRHELHHRGWAFNYNLLNPLGDLVFGTYKSPK